jgi:hypothetical protein
MPNTSATGGYLSATTLPLPAGLSFDRYIQQVVVGITGFDPSLVRPRWQVEAPKQPDITVNWCAVGIVDIKNDYDAHFEQHDDDATMKRHQIVEMLCTFYGADAVENASLFRDGLELSQNREQLFLANMGLLEVGTIVTTPELVNGRWCMRADVPFIIRREVIRDYAIMKLLSAGGDIVTDNDPQIISAWSTLNVQP